MQDNKNSYLIKKKGKEELKNDQLNAEKEKEIDEKEIYDLIKGSALLTGLESAKKNNERKIKSIAGWKFPKKYLNLKTNHIEEIRKAYKIEVDGENVPG